MYLNHSSINCSTDYWPSSTNDEQSSTNDGLSSTYNYRSTNAWLLNWLLLTTMVLPMMDWGPAKSIILSVMLILATPSSPAVTLPRSPTCLSASSGAPCSLLKGLKWAPALVQPTGRSQKVKCLPGFQYVHANVTLFKSHVNHIRWSK